MIDGIIDSPTIVLDGNIKMQLHGQYSFKSDGHWLEVYDMGGNATELQAKVNTNKILFISMTTTTITRE